MRKWIFFILIIIIGGIVYGVWLEKQKEYVIKDILDNTSLIDSLSVKDGKTKEEIIILTNSNSSFSEILEVYELPYMNLKLTERRVINKDPFADVDYMSKNEIKYKVSIYKVNNKDKSIIQSIDKRISTDKKHFSYVYYPDDENVGYVFSIKSNYQLLGVNEGLKELLDTIISKTKK